jgi:outer membrane protein OmpA-like peptidoglycan-associated protein
MKVFITSLSVLGILSAMLPAQAQQPEPTPVFRTTVVARTTKAVSYRHRSGSTKIDFAGTQLLPQSRGEAKVESKQGRIAIDAEFKNLVPAHDFGPEYLTYVLWAITPEGRALNLGEVLLNGRNSKLSVTTEIQAFGLIVTAEPYYAVTQPSDIIVMENELRPDTLGKSELIDAKYELLKKGQYTVSLDPKDITTRVVDPAFPLEMYEARNAVLLARAAGADKYAADVWQKANRALQQAEEYHARKQKKPSQMLAREAVQTSEDARLLALQRREEEQLANERAASADREAKAKAEAAAETLRRARAEMERQKAEQERAAAEQERIAAQERQRQAELDRAASDRARMEAELASAKSAREKADAEAARQAALLQQQAAQAETEKARLAVDEANRLRQRAEQDRAELRVRLQQQLNMILQTRDTARGLIVNMSDVLFDTGKFTLRPLAREKLAKISGIVLAHPGLRLEVEGHTDSVGGEEYNQKLSEQRAGGVRDYLVSQGLPIDAITARGFGKTQPVADNSTAAGRQQNRRVELVVSGESVIGGVAVQPTTSSPQ